MALLAITDVIIKAFEGVRQNDIKRETLYLLLRYALYYLRMTASKKMNPTVDSRISDAILHHWALIIGHVAEFEYVDFLHEL